MPLNSKMNYNVDTMFISNSPLSYKMVIKDLPVCQASRRLAQTNRWFLHRSGLGTECDSTTCSHQPCLANGFFPIILEGREEARSRS